MENHSRFVECCAAGERSGLYYTCVNSFLTAPSSSPLSSTTAFRRCSSRRRRSATSRSRRWSIARGSSSVSIVDGPGEGDAGAQSQRGDGRSARNPNCRRGAGRSDALFLRARQPKGGCVPCLTGRPADPLSLIAARLNFWRFREGPDLPFARATLSLGAAGGRQRDDQAPAERSSFMERFDAGTLPCARRAISRHPHPACSDDVLAHAEAAGSGSPGLTISRRSRSPSTLRRRCPSPSSGR